MTEIAIIGGGVIGASLAFHLAARKLGRVTLFERDRLGSGTTWHSAGNITWKPGGDSDAPNDYALQLVQRLGQEGRQSTGWLTTGRLFLGLSERGLAPIAAIHRDALDRGVAGLWLSPQEAAARHPLLAAEAIAGAWLNPKSGRLNPADYTAALAAAGKAEGAVICEGAGVERIRAQDGRVQGLTIAGEDHAFDIVVAAAGLWTRALLQPLGYAAAQWGCEHFYLIAETTPRLARETPSFVCAQALLYGREEVGGLLFGLFDEKAKTFDPAALPDPFSFSLLPEDWDQVAPYVEDAMRLFPVLQEAPIRNFINGPEAFTPDGDPLIGPVPGIEGLYIASGMNSHGVTIAAATGHMIADWIAGDEHRFETAPYDPTRFGAKASDEAWLAREISDTPSRFYRRTFEGQS